MSGRDRVGDLSSTSFFLHALFSEPLKAFPMKNLLGYLFLEIQAGMNELPACVAVCLG